jgi:hypothetical protein
MTTTYLVPIAQSVAQTFTVTLNNVQYNFRLVWNAATDCWVLDISDSTGTPIAQGLPLIDGADILQQLFYLGIGGALVVDIIPTFETLGNLSNLYFLTPT